MPAITELCALASRAASQRHHLIARDQLHELSVSEKQIHLWQGTGFLTKVEPNVFLVAGGSLTWRARLLSVCMSTGGVASHRSAAALHALAGCKPGRPEIVAPRGAWSGRRDIRQHESTDLHLVRPIVVDSIPVTPVARTLLDLGAVVPFLVEDATRDAVARRLTTWPELFSTLVSHSRKGRRGCGPLRAVLDEHYGDKTESNLERRFLRLVRAAGLPEPQQQVDAFDDAGFIMRIDFAFPELKIAIEIDSVLYHATDAAFEDDPVKRNRLGLAGWLVLSFTSRRMRVQPTGVCEDLAQAIRNRTPVLSSVACAGGTSP
jgi:very-short-patch-repair endonuclease